MPDIADATCGFCGKSFKLRPDQLGRKVLCPHCKTIVVIEKPTEFAREAIEALGPKIAVKRPVTAHRQVSMSRGGVRSMGVAVAWVVVLAMALIGVIVALVLLHGREGPSAGTSRGPAPPPAPRPGPVRVVRPPPPGPTEGPAVVEGEVPAPPPPSAGVSVTVEGRPLEGSKDGTVTYVVGKVGNYTPQEARGVRISIKMQGEANAVIGEATALVRRLAPNEQVPFVAAWTHAPDVRALAWTPGHTILPEVAEEVPVRMEVNGAIWPKPDAGEFPKKGELVIPVLNAGRATALRIEVWAILRDAKGGVLSAARDEIKETIIPGNGTDLHVRYEQALGSQIKSVQAYVQGIAAP